MPCLAPRMRPTFACARASRTAPTSDWLMTIEGPPDWAITMFIFFMSILYHIPFQPWATRPVSSAADAKPCRSQ